jgi:ethanolaminephosphotransferase
MYLPWGYDISMVGGTVLYALTSVVGYQAWKYTLPGGLSPGPLFEFLLYLGSAGMAVPVALRNIYRSYRDGTGHMRSFGEAVRPLVSFFLAMLLCLLWANLSANNILFEDTRMFFYVSGTLCANMSCRLIVAQMSNTRCELFNVLLALLAAAVASSLLIPGFPREAELSILYLLAIVFTVMHLHYGICVVIQMCRHLKIEAFRIKYHGEVRLLSSHPDVDDDDNSFNDDEVIDVADANDLEIVVTSNSKTGNAVKPATVKSHVLQV